MSSQFLDLDVEFEQQCGYDYVNVYTENFTTGHSEKRCGKYREDTLEQLWFQSSGNIMGVQLSSDFKYGYRGYHAQYYSLDQRQGCNKTLTLESGSISSWNYPSNYFPNLHCNILINVATDQRIRFEIQFLDIQNGTVEYLCDTDFLQVFQGQGTRPTTFCGTTDKYRHDQLIFDSEENEIQLLFYSDYLTEKDGFLGRYYALDSCRNESIFAMNGTISSPNYPNFYPNSQDCYITLQAPQGYQLLVHFETFNTQDGNLDSCNDFVEVFTGNDTIKLCGNWQGRQNQLVYQSVSNIFRIHFFTDGYGTAKGFRADFSAILYNRTVVFNPTCPQGWLHFKRFCYEIVNITRTWYEANDACQREGTNLASIHSLGEQHFINSAICESTGTENGAYWIGGHDQHYEAEFMWADNSVFNFTDWFPGWSAFNYFGKQPTDDGFSTEDCIELRQVFHYPSKGEGRANRYYWNDRDCHTQNHYICKQLAFGVLD
ncbi:CUB domain-containing protein 2-like [Glandiceps talaboti]